MQADAVGAEFGQLLHGLDRVKRLPDRLAERVAAGIADGPEPECEAVLGAWCQIHLVRAHPPTVLSSTHDSTRGLGTARRDRSPGDGNRVTNVAPLLKTGD